ncbi:MAG: hypothetical protein K6L73_06030 [Cellvibrionaceae bacterium]
MGLFSRNDEKSNNSYMDEVKLPGKNDIDDIFLEPDDEEDMELPSSIGDSEAAPSPTPTAKPKGTYGIEDAIDLMRDLPKDSKEVVVTVVKKTLESTNIKVSDIISDASGKEDRLRKQNSRLEDEIAKLEAQISDRRSQISDLMTDLKETSEVKDLLQLAEKLNKPAEKPQKAKSNPPPNTNSAPKSQASTNTANALTSGKPAGNAGANNGKAADKPKVVTGQPSTSTSSSQKAS